MNSVVTFEGNKVPAALANLFAGVNTNDDLKEGVSAGFAIVTQKGSRWGIKRGKEDTVLVLNPEGNPVGSLEVVLVKANKHLSKNYYEKGYVEGSSEAPDCYSADGITPALNAPKKQAVQCASCPKNVIGSKISDAGKKSKACADSRRIAVVPAGDITNEVHGGLMLMRVPAMSLRDLAEYGDGMKLKGFPYYAIVTRISFDTDVAYPKFKFKAVRPLTNEEAAKVVEHLKGSQLDSVLDEAQNVTITSPQAAPVTTVEDNTEFEQPPQGISPVAAATVAAATRKPRVTKPKPEAAAPAPVAIVNTDGDVGEASDEELDELLANLDLDT